MTRLLYQCPKCPQIIGFRVSAKHLGKRYILSHAGCKAKFMAVIPLNVLAIASDKSDSGNSFTDLFGDFPDFFGNLGKKTDGKK